MSGRLRGSSKRACLLAASLLAAAQAAPALAEDTPRAAKAGAPAVSACVTRYHASLERIAGAEFQAVRSAGASAAATGDDRLPGTLFFPPPPAGARSQAETAALRSVAALARSKGRSVGVVGADAKWMADRLRLSLSDYLTQSPSPYLCGGVEDYVATLRGFAARLGAAPRDREAAIAVQTGVAGRAILEALAVLKPAPAPSPAPGALPAGDRPAGTPAAGLRPAAGLDRTEGANAAAPAGTVAAGEDADLPPSTAPTAPPLSSVADLAAAVDRLMDAARTGGFVTATPNAMPIGLSLAIDPGTHPVLARLAAARPAVFGPKPLVGDRTARLRLAAALSAIEALDYLMRARAEPADPLASAIDAAFEAILKAHKADCTCRD